MKKIVNILRTTGLMVVLGLGLCITSCTDFLTIYPPNSTTHDDYWHTEDDVNGMLAEAYRQLISDAAVLRYYIWGEVRADNLVNSDNAAEEYKYIVEAYLTEKNSYCDWSKFYAAINAANMVIEFAPLVPERDPDFSQGDLNVVMGEMYALRALCHFYLVRTFRDIPLSYVASVTDANLPEYPQVHPMVALDSIMSDLNRAEPLVMASGAFPTTNDIYNTCRITRNAVRAMKADVALWQAAFARYYAQQTEDDTDGDVSDDNVTENEGTTDDAVTEGEGLTKADVADDETASDSETPSAPVTFKSPDEYYNICIENCRLIVEDMNALMEEKYNYALESTPIMGPGSENPYYLVSNIELGKEEDKDLLVSPAYDRIFGLCASDETIFELEFDGDINSNGAVFSMFGSGSGGNFYVPESFITLYDAKDWRRSTFITPEGEGEGDNSSEGGAEASVLKFVVRASGPKTETDNKAAREYQNSGECDANWIMYRKTDVMLMWAEAISLLTSPSAEQLSKAFDLVKAVNERSSLEGSVLTEVAPSALNDLVLDERARELAFEGKRWFDLVRKALRENGPEGIRDRISQKSSTSGNTIKNRMNHVNNLFFPISERELKVNTLLKQNPAYKSSESIELH